VVDYGLAPERPFPEGLNDALAVYRAVLDDYSPGAISVFGSSAGGALAVAMLLEAHREGLPMPAALGLVSPWSDLAENGDSYLTLKSKDPVIDYELTLAYAAQLYAGKNDPRDPLISPVNADFPEDFPPTLIQGGTRDLFLSNCVRLHRKMKMGGVQAGLSLWDGMWHAFQITPGLPEANEALSELARFLTSPGAYFSPDR
jgi:acetyl esterase/lipase